MSLRATTPTAWMWVPRNGGPAARKGGHLGMTPHPMSKTIPKGLVATQG